MKKILTVVIAAIITQSLTAQIRIKVSHDTTNDIQYDAVPVPQATTTVNVHSCSKFRIQVTNDNRCLLGSRTRWILGYVTTGNSTQYWDFWGTQIDKSKVVSYTELPKYNRSLFSDKKSSSQTSTLDVVKNN
ncbi:MAG TPA: hypothetical protein VK559_00900 [Ferruginibacter sp.]|nr:hypothetical protein [Ferruginibacter sp.]